MYHWRELPQASFLSRQKFCRYRDKHVSFGPTKLCLPRQNYVYRDKIFLSQRTRVRRNKHTFVVTKDVFCRDKHVFVATKIILVAAPTNDNNTALHVSPTDNNSPYLPYKMFTILVHSSSFSTMMIFENNVVYYNSELYF